MKDIKNRIINISIFLSIIGINLIGTFLIGIYTNIDTTCPIYKYLGYSCPGCGGTRMVLSILKLDLHQAFRYNAFLFISIFTIIPISIYQIYVYIRKGVVSNWYTVLMVVYLILTIMFGIIRNINTFKWLLPTNI